MMQKKSPFRTLFAVYALALLAGICEFVFGVTRKKDEPDIFGNPKFNFPAAMERLFPGSSEAEYLIGRRLEAHAGRGFNQTDLQQNPLMLQRFVDQLHTDLEEAARHYERAISMGLKSEESLYYNYALTLIRIQDDPARIDRAIAMWQRNFPYSERRDLRLRRQAIEEQLRQLPAPSAVSDDGRRSNLPPDGTQVSRPFTSLKPNDEDAFVDSKIEWNLHSEYVGSHACQQCHPKQFESFQATSHSRALSEVSPQDEPENTVFDHASSSRRYRVARRDGKLIHEESLPFEDGSEFVLTSTPVRYRVGSGHFARTYLCDAGGGFFFESPITWYESSQKWDMTPGFDKPTHRSFSRQVLENCLWCHTGHTEMSTTSHFRLKIIENSIGCERCHGPGDAHVKARTAGGSTVTPANDPIVNPSKLERKLAEAVCHQCHLQGDIHIGGSNVRASDFRPGKLLEEFSTIYRLRKRSTDMTVVGHAEQMHASQCYQKTESLTCATCHDPHATVPSNERTEHFRSVCLNCHTAGCKVPITVRDKTLGNDCVQCHMPKSKTEVPHLAFTHHRIGIHPIENPSQEWGDREQLVALSDLSTLSDFDRRRSFMLANLQLYLIRGPEFQKSAFGQNLGEEIARWLASLDAREFDVEIEFAKTQFLLATGDFIKAEQSANRLLASDRIRSEERTALLESLARIQFQKQQIEQSRQQYLELTRLRCQGRDWFYLGICEGKLFHRESAIRAFERSRQLEPAISGVYVELERAYRSQSNFISSGQIAEDLTKLRAKIPPSN